MGEGKGSLICFMFLFSHGEITKSFIIGIQTYNALTPIPSSVSTHLYQSPHPIFISILQYISSRCCFCPAVCSIVVDRVSHITFTTRMGLSNIEINILNFAIKSNKMPQKIYRSIPLINIIANVFVCFVREPYLAVLSFSLAFWGAPGGVQGFFLALHSGIIPIGTRRAICDTRDRTRALPAMLSFRPPAQGLLLLLNSEFTAGRAWGIIRGAGN